MLYLRHEIVRTMREHAEYFDRFEDDISPEEIDGRTVGIRETLTEKAVYDAHTYLEYRAIAALMLITKRCMLVLAVHAPCGIP